MAQIFLIIRFRQMGDTVLTTPILDTLRRNFPDSRIDIVLNERLAPLLEHHPSVSNVITFTERERHNIFTYVRKVWRIMHAVRYDMVIDMRSNMNTLLFSLLAKGKSVRSGIDKGYSRLFLTDRLVPCGQREYIVDYNLRLLAPLERYGTITYERRLSLTVTDDERKAFKDYMRQCGIDFCRPVMLAGVTAKLEHKAWRRSRMTDVLRRITATFPDVQIVLNYAPGREETDARMIADALNSRNIFLGVEAKGLRKLMAMASCCTLYFGNEGGTRHIMQAMGKPTFSICSPAANLYTWIPADDERHQAVCPDDFATAEQLSVMTYEQRYDLITPDEVWKKLVGFVALNRG